MSKEKNILEKLSSLLLKTQTILFYLYNLIICSIYFSSYWYRINDTSYSSFFEDSSNSILINNLKDILELQSNISNFKIILIFTTSTIILSNIVFLISAYFSTKINFLVEQNIRGELFKFYVNGNLLIF